MTEAERIARAQRATLAYAEFFEPMLDELRSTYTARMVEIATTELNPAKRAEKITALSNAIKITNTLDSGMAEIMRDGDLARREMLKADKIEQMTKPQRRLLNMAGY